MKCQECCYETKEKDEVEIVVISFVLFFLGIIICLFVRGLIRGALIMLGIL